MQSTLGAPVLHISHRLTVWPCVCSCAIKPFAPPCCATHNFGPKDGGEFLALPCSWQQLTTRLLSLAPISLGWNLLARSNPP